MRDRSSKHPGRIALTDVETGQRRLYDTERADEPIEQGTSMSTATILPDNLSKLFSDKVPASVTLADVFQRLTKAAFLLPNGALADIRGNDMSPYCIMPYQGDGVYPKRITFPFPPRMAFAFGHASGGKGAVSYICGSAETNLSLTSAGSSGVQVNDPTYLDGFDVVIDRDPGGSIAGAHNVPGAWERILAIR